MSAKITFKSRLPIFALFFLLAYHNLSAQTFSYPPTPKEPVADTLWGKVVVDDYRWLEDINSHKVKQWLKKQADFTDSIFDRIPGRDVLIAEYKQLDKLKSEHYGFFIKSGGNRYFYEKTLPGEKSSKLYYRDTKIGREILLYDPTADTTDKTKASAFRFFPSPDGRKAALLLSGGGIEISRIIVLDVDNRKFYPESIYPAGEITGWSPDQKGFIYSAPQTNDHLSNDLYKDMRAMYHLVGTDPAKDRVIFSRQHNPDLDIKPNELLSVVYSPDGEYVVCFLNGGTLQNRSFFAQASKVSKGKIQWMPLIKNGQQNVASVAIDRDRAFLFIKDAAVAGYKLLMCPLQNFDISNATEILFQADRTLVYTARSLDYLFIHSTDGLNYFVDQYHLETGEISALTFPFSGAAYVNAYNDKTNDCFLRVWSRNRPLAIYDYDPVMRQAKPSGFNSSTRYPGVDDLVVEEVEVPGHDGVKIPLSIVYNKNLVKDGNNVAFMRGYGSYGFTAVPWLDISFIPLFNRGVILAITHTRGDGDRGHAWHMGGFKATKPNTWKDFISCAEYLVAKGYTSPGRLIGEGTSAGGILIGRAITERPDLFAASIHDVPLSNPLRGENRPNGDTDAREFGTVKDSVEAMGLIAMDPYLHVRQGVNYPAILATAGINDSRVPVWQPAKFAAAMQRASTSGRPVLLEVNYDSGHMSDEKSVRSRILANKYAFALWQVGFEEFQLR